MKGEDITFSIRCTMRKRWVPHFLGMLKMMQRLGSVGSSRVVAIYADGDGDFRPKFEPASDEAPFDTAEPLYDRSKQTVNDQTVTCDFFFDAG